MKCVFCTFSMCDYVGFSQIRSHFNMLISVVTDCEAVTLETTSIVGVSTVAHMSALKNNRMGSR